MISVTDNGAVRSLLLDRPEALNAFNNRMFDQLADALLLAADDDSVKVVVITGAGRAFSAGLDLASIGSMNRSTLCFFGMRKRGDDFAQKGFRCV